MTLRNIVLICVVGIWSVMILGCSQEKKTYTIGSVNNCRTSPAFTTVYKLKPPFYIHLRQKTKVGFSIIEANKNGRELILPSWSSAGTLGAYSMDGKGNIYISPMPHVSLYNSPLLNQNLIKIWLMSFLSFS